ncbi:acyl-CoA thioesterase [soil metagenome]
MYPILRFALATARARRAGALPIDGIHVSRHACLPIDIDPWSELNNGRTLTLYDLGRIALIIRIGLVATVAREGWGYTLAGAAIRYRRRVRAFHRFEMRSACLGHDARFLYVHQTMWRRGEALSAALFRIAITGPDGIVPTGRFLAAHGAPDWRPALPDWVAAWIAAEDARPWPPP